MNFSWKQNSCVVSVSVISEGRSKKVICHLNLSKISRCGGVNHFNSGNIYCYDFFKPANMNFFGPGNNMNTSKREKCFSAWKYEFFRGLEIWCFLNFWKLEFSYTSLSRLCLWLLSCPFLLIAHLACTMVIFPTSSYSDSCPWSFCLFDPI